MSKADLFSAFIKYNIEGVSKIFSTVSGIPNKITELVKDRIKQKQAAAEAAVEAAKNRFVPNVPKYDRTGRISQAWKNSIYIKVHTRSNDTQEKIQEVEKILNPPTDEANKVVSDSKAPPKQKNGKMNPDYKAYLNNKLPKHFAEKAEKAEKTKKENEHMFLQLGIDLNSNEENNSLFGERGSGLTV